MKKLYLETVHRSDYEEKCKKYKCANQERQSSCDSHVYSIQCDL